MLKELFPSDMQSIPFETSIEWLPFYPTKKAAIQNFNSEIIKLKDEDTFYGYYEKGKLIFIVHLTMSLEVLEIQNLLILSQQVSLFDYQRYLIEIAKRRRAKQILLKLPQQYFGIHDNLYQKGFLFIQEKGYLLDVSYHTGLVLGGGGAKGAYQIGVWRALEEMGITFEMISGTSVGALNGGLIVQGDIERAEKMWQSIATEKILSLPSTESRTHYTAVQLMNDIQQLTLKAIQGKGVSTEPLLNLIKSLIIPEKMLQSQYDFFIITTALPTMEEKILSLKEMIKEDLPLWLLASSSFFPAMAACLIDEVYYVDGGYRNNVPRDILINHGAQDLIVVDVDGPGITKPTKIPKTVTEIYLKSSWSLGNVLLFDGNRSSWNMALGYLETKKAYGQYAGNLYTFNQKEFKKKSLQLSRDFFKYLQGNLDFMEWFDKKSSLKIWEWLLKNKLTPEFLSILLIESLAKKFNIQPIQAYDIEEMIALLREMASQKELASKTIETEQMLLSMTELISSYIKQNSPVTEYQLLTYYYHYFERVEPKNKESFHLLMEISWLKALEALFLLFLEKRN